MWKENKYQRKYWQEIHERGVTLIEVSIAISIMAIMAAAILWAFQSSNVARQTEMVMQEIATIKTAATSLYGNTSDYSGINSEVLISSRMLPRRMHQGANELRSIFNTTINVSSVNVDGGTDNGLEITFTRIPAEPCIQIANIDLGTSLQSVTIDGTSGGGQNSTYSENQFPLSVSDITQDCGNTVADITWTFR